MSDNLIASGGCWGDGQGQEPRSELCTPPHPAFQPIRTAVLVAYKTKKKMRNEGNRL